MSKILEFERCKGWKGKSILYTLNENGCWECISHAKDKDGYTRVWFDGKNDKLHRVIYKITHGDINSDVIIRHKCDNPSCFNVEHLEAGTHQDNISDKVNRGRVPKGESHVNFGKKLSQETRNRQSNSSPSKISVRCIELEKIYTSMTEAEKELHIAEGCISKVCRGILKTTGGYHWEKVTITGTTPVVTAPAK